jgi:hypothetical protein
MTVAWGRVRRLTLEGAAALVVAVFLWKLGSAFVRVAIHHQATSAFFASATWGLLVLASFAGWGATLNAVLFPRDRADWGLRCAWGWAAAVAIGGALCAVRLAGRGALEAVVALGLVGLGVELARAYRAWTRRNVWRWLRRASSEASFSVGAAAVFAVGCVTYLASIVNGDFNTNDDTLCYFGFAREILDRGTLTQPFSFRRISVYGGQQLLDAVQIAIPVPDTHLHLLDQGMALLAVMALLVGHVKASRRTSRAVILLALLLAVTLPEIRANTGAAMTGVVFFLGLYRTLTWAPVQRGQGLRDGVIVALLAAGACALRQNYLAPIGILLLLEYGAPIAASVRLRPLRVDAKAVRRAALTAAMIGLFLAPWWAMAQRWCATFLFPIVAGTYNPDYDFFKPLKLFDELKYIWANACYCLPVKAVPLFLVAALTSIDRARSRTLVHFAIATFVGVAMLIQHYPDVDAATCARYYFGFTFAALLAIALEVGSSSPARAPRAVRGARADRAVGLPLIVAAVALQLYADRDATTKQFDGYLTAIQKEWEQPASPWTPPEPDPAYATLQAAVPEGARIATMVDQYDRFDLRRNEVESLDMIGAVSPPPGLPLFRSADAVADYLVAQGYRYLIVVHPDAANFLYRRDVWQRQQQSALPVWQRTARFYLRGFDVFDELRKTRAHVADAGPMTAMDLTLRAK